MYSRSQRYNNTVVYRRHCVEATIHSQSNFPEGIIKLIIRKMAIHVHVLDHRNRSSILIVLVLASELFAIEIHVPCDAGTLSVV